jgi:hypothetical protein
MTPNSMIPGRIGRSARVSILYFAKSAPPGGRFALLQLIDSSSAPRHARPEIRKGDDAFYPNFIFPSAPVPPLGRTIQTDRYA